MLLAVLATSSISAPPPVAVGLVTLAFCGQVVFSAPSDTSVHVLLCSFGASVVNVVPLIRLRYFLKMCVVPDWSLRAIGEIVVSGLHPAPDSALPSTPSSWLHFVIVPR